MKKKYFISFVIVIVLFFMQNTTAYAAVSGNLSANGAVVHASYESIYFIDKYVGLESNTQYISSTFRPTTDRISFIFQSFGEHSLRNTFYIEKLDSNGKWSVVYTHVISGGVSRSTSETVKPNELYRVRVANTNQSYAKVYIEVHEVVPKK